MDLCLRKEGAQGIEYLSISKSINKIIEIKEPGASALYSSKFGGKITTVCTRYYDDYSFDTSKEIELWTDGTRKDISLNDCLFSYLVKGSERLTKSSGYSFYLTIEGCWSNNEEFSFFFSLSRYMDVLISIIFAIIIISETKDLDKSRSIMKIICTECYCSNPADRLKMIIEGEECSKKILEKYPFMVSLYKSGLRYQIEKAKEEISNLKFLK